MANNENPLGPSPRVIEAIGSVAPTLNGYPDWTDIGLRQAIADVLGRGLTPAHIYSGCSGFEALELLARAFLQAGDELILSSPTFSGAYKKVALPLGARVIDVPLEAETFRYRPDAVLEAITDKTRLVMVCNPNNPTGTIISASALDELMRGLPEHVLVVADEVYHHFVDDAAYPDTLQYVLDGRNIVIIHSFSKAYGMAGMRLGYGIARPEIANFIAGLHRGFHQNKSRWRRASRPARTRRIYSAPSPTCKTNRAGFAGSLTRWTSATGSQPPTSYSSKPSCPLTSSMRSCWRGDSCCARRPASACPTPCASVWARGR